jgi:hypothetical protein
MILGQSTRSRKRKKRVRCFKRRFLCVKQRIACAGLLPGYGYLKKLRSQDGFLIFHGNAAGYFILYINCLPLLNVIVD